MINKRRMKKLPLRIVINWNLIVFNQLTNQRIIKKGTSFQQRKAENKPKNKKEKYKYKQ